MSCKEKNKDLLMRQRIAFENAKKSHPNVVVVEMIFEGSLDNLIMLGIDLDSVLSIVKRNYQEYVVSYRQEIN